MLAAVGPIAALDFHRHHQPPGGARRRRREPRRILERARADHDARRAGREQRVERRVIAHPAARLHLRGARGEQRVERGAVRPASGRGVEVHDVERGEAESITEDRGKG